MRVLLALLLTVLTPLVLAGDLTGQDVRLWIKSMPQLEQWLDEHEDQLPEDDLAYDDFSVDGMFDKGIRELRNAGLYNGFNREVKSAGYRDVEHWAEISRRVSLGYLALEMENEQVSSAQLEAQLQQIRESDLPAEQKAMMEQMMSASLLMMKAVDGVSMADKEAVRPYRSQLADQFGESDGE